MSFWELLALVGTMATIFGIFITVFAIVNGRSTRKILLRIEQGQTEARREMAEAIKFLAQLIVSGSEKTRQLVKSRSEKPAE